MDKIGFKNFRKFENLEPLELAPITLLVGGNNAGKSTIVKGLLALSDFLKRDWLLEQDFDFEEVEDGMVMDRMALRREMLKNIRFYFNANYMTHLGTFKRALYNRADDNTITFKTEQNHTEIQILVNGNPDNEERVYGTVSKVLMTIRPINVDFEFDFIEDVAKITFHKESYYGHLEPLHPRIQSVLKEYFSGIAKDYTFVLQISAFWENNRRSPIRSLIYAVENCFETLLHEKNEPSLFSHDRSSRGYAMNGIISTCTYNNEDIEFLSYFTKTFGSFPPRPIASRERFFFPLFEVFRNRQMDYEYVYAHAVSQTVIYSAKDTHDYLSRTVHEFASVQNKAKKDFISDWMKKFKIGKSFFIKSVGGEAHVVYIVNFDGEKVNLADKGMGSIQLMVLLFRMAILLPSESSSLALRYKTIILEEPEQNLHPKLQTLLAEFFYELSKKGFRFIIETHSEYLIRKTQVLVKDFYEHNSSRSANPFKVYYFNSLPQDNPYYEMEYQLDGCFANDFGEGFFDEASNLAYEIL